MFNTWLTKNFDIDYPIIMAPMFLVSGEEMLMAASKSKIMGCIPALNYRTEADFEKALQRLNDTCPGPYGINLIVNKSNVRYKNQLELCKKYEPAFIITSLGNPKEVIDELKDKKTKVFCDVVDVQYAKKVELLGADAIIAVNSGAGGHAGKVPQSILIPMLKKHVKLPIISAGGVSTGAGILSTLILGAEGLSIGSPFIAAKEAKINDAYKEAIIKYGAEDIVFTNKISGTPCTVINTPYVKKIGTEQNILERTLNTNKTLKKYTKMLTYFKGMKLLEKAAFSATYKSLWCAGPSIEFVTSSESCEEIIKKMISESVISKKELDEKFTHS